MISKTCRILPPLNLLHHYHHKLLQLLSALRKSHYTLVCLLMQRVDLICSRSRATFHGSKLVVHLHSACEEYQEGANVNLVEVFKLNNLSHKIKQNRRGHDSEYPCPCPCLHWQLSVCEAAEASRLTYRSWVPWGWRSSPL